MEGGRSGERDISLSQFKGITDDWRMALLGMLLGEYHFTVGGWGGAGEGGHRVARSGVCGVCGRQGGKLCVEGLGCGGVGIGRGTWRVCAL